MHVMSIGIFVIFTPVKAKKISVLFFKIMLVSLMLLKPVLASANFLTDQSSNVVFELTESEEDRSEKTSFESDDEIFHLLNMEWSHHVGSMILIKLVDAETDIEEHIREIVPPPPQV